MSFVFLSTVRLRHQSTFDLLGGEKSKWQICGKAFRIERNLILHQKVHLGQRFKNVNFVASWKVQASFALQKHFTSCFTTYILVRLRTKFFRDSTFE